MTKLENQHDLKQPVSEDKPFTSFCNHYFNNVEAALDIDQYFPLTKWVDELKSKRSEFEQSEGPTFTEKRQPDAALPITLSLDYELEKVTRFLEFKQQLITVPPVNPVFYGYWRQQIRAIATLLGILDYLHAINKEHERLTYEELESIGTCFDFAMLEVASKNNFLSKFMEVRLYS